MTPGYLPNRNENSVHTNTSMQMFVPEFIIPNPGNKVFFNWWLGCISYLMLCKNYPSLSELGGYILQQTIIVQFFWGVRNLDVAEMIDFGIKSLVR